MGNQTLVEYSVKGQEHVRAILHIPYIVSLDSPRYGEDFPPFLAYNHDDQPIHLVNSLFSSEGMAGNEIDPKKAANGC
jgi:hypothetical protein